MTFFRNETKNAGRTRLRIRRSDIETYLISSYGILALLGPAVCFFPKGPTEAFV
jgi:hypothetical protein